jgi:hypothetical protein
VSPGPKTQSLIELLERLASLLRYHDEDDWASWLESDRDLLQRGEIEGGISHMLSAFGGMGSINDLTLDSASGLALQVAEKDRVNTLLRALLSQAYDLATTISRVAASQ